MTNPTKSEVKDQQLREKIEEILWFARFKKPKPNLPFKSEESQIEGFLDQLVALFEDEIKIQYLLGVRDGQKRYWEYFDSIRKLMVDAIYELKKKIDKEKG